jgi:hypothetical protein
VRFILLLTFFLSCFSHSGELDMFEFDSTVPPSLALSTMAEVEENVSAKIAGAWGYEGDVKISRIFASDMFAVNFKGATYITDSSAESWIQNGNTGFFQFSPYVRRVATSNYDRENLMKFGVFIEKLKRHLPTYKAFAGEREHIYVFVDMTCPHCRKFHLSQRVKFQKKGYSFTYIPFLRDPSNKRFSALNKWTFCADVESVKTNIDNVYSESIVNKALAYMSQESPYFTVIWRKALIC